MAIETLAFGAAANKTLVGLAVSAGLVSGGAVAHEVYTGDGNFLATDNYSMQDLEKMVNDGSLQCRVTEEVKDILGPSFVKVIQTELNEEGYSRSGPDDIFGNETCKDVLNLQYDQYHGGNTGFWIDGVVGKQTLGVLQSSSVETSEATQVCKITADVNGDGDTTTDDYADVLAFQEKFNQETGSSITEDGDRGPETNGAIKNLQEVVGTVVDCDWGNASMRAFEEHVSNTSATNTPNKQTTDDDGVRDGCEPYHASTQIVLCGSAGQGDEPIELYVRGDDGNMYLQSSALGRSSRYDSDGAEGNDDCITPRNHVLLDKSAMQIESSKGLEFYIPFSVCGGGEGTAFHYYPELSQAADSHGCFRAPYGFIENAFWMIKNGGQTEVIVRDK